MDLSEQNNSADAALTAEKDLAIPLSLPLLQRCTTVPYDFETSTAPILKRTKAGYRLDLLSPSNPRHRHQVTRLHQLSNFSIGNKMDLKNACKLKTGKHNVVFLLDVSGSMSLYKEVTKIGISEFLNVQKERTDANTANLKMFTFSNSCDMVYDGSISDSVVPEYKIGGNTAYFGSVRMIADSLDPSVHTVFATLTDGRDNWNLTNGECTTLAQAHAAVNKPHITFIQLCAGDDCVSVQARALSADTNLSFEFDQAQTPTAMRQLSRAISLCSGNQAEPTLLDLTKTETK